MQLHLLYCCWNHPHRTITNLLMEGMASTPRDGVQFLKWRLQCDRILYSRLYLDGVPISMVCHPQRLSPDLTVVRN
jgi:hypothetical protein